ncbi:MAG: magnesium transporter [Bacteroidota bacterium]
MTAEETRPWEPLIEYLSADDAMQIKTHLDQLNADDIAAALSHLNEDERAKLFHVLTAVEGAELIDDIPWDYALRILEEISPDEAASIINELSSDAQADFIGEMDAEGAEAILEELSADVAENVKELIQYEPDTAGGLMITEYLAFEESRTVGEVIKDLGENADQYEKYHLQYLYVTADGQFIGVLNMRNLLLSKPSTPLSSIVLRSAQTVDVNEDLEGLIRFFDTHDFYGVPVLGDNEEMRGVILRKDLREAQQEDLNNQHLETQGIVGGEELRTMPVLLRARRRLSWLSVNILLNIAAASVIAVYQDTLSAVIALAVFLPIISDMSGCSGNQAVAVSLRELSLGVVKPFELARVWIQEVSVGLINGVVLGLLIGTAAWLWQGNFYLGLVVGGALCINTLVAVSLGGIIPLALKRFDIDPALASGPLLTTVTDMCGFFLALTFAGAMINLL